MALAGLYVMAVAGGASAHQIAATSSVLAGTYGGAVTVDGGATAGLTVSAVADDYSPGYTDVSFSLGPGAQIDCYGKHDIGGRTVNALAWPPTVLGDGSSTYTVDNGKLKTGLDGAAVTIYINNSATTLSPDGRTFSGVLRFELVFIDSQLQPCSWNWPFTTTLVDRVVPSVLELRTAAATAVLHAAGLKATVTSEVDPLCNDIGHVMRQDPDAGTHVPDGSSVTIVIGARPKTPCP